MVRAGHIGMEPKLEKCEKDCVKKKRQKKETYRIKDKEVG